MKRRCDGEHIINRGDPLPCVCDEERRECSMITRLSFILPEIPGLGTWLLKSGGYAVATELAGAIGFLLGSINPDDPLPVAILALESRERKVEGEKFTRRWVEPVLTVEGTPLAALAPSSSPAVPAITDGGGVPEPDPALVVPPNGTQVKQYVPDLTIVEDVPMPEEPPPDDGPRSDEPPPYYEVDLTPEEPMTKESLDNRQITPDVFDGVELNVLLKAEVAEGNMDDIKKRTYRLFELMTSAGHWGEGKREAALEDKYGHSHLTKLNKAELVTFATLAFLNAREVVDA